MTDGPTSRIYLDATFLIEMFDGTPENANRILGLLEILEARPNRAVTSELTLAEVMGKESPALGWALQSRSFLNLLVWRKFIDLRPVSREILFETGKLRRAVRQTGRALKLPDAIHVMTAVKSRCRYLLSSDTRLALPAGIQRLDPRLIAGADLEKLLDA